MANRSAYLSLKRLFTSIFGTSVNVPRSNYVIIYDGSDVKKTTVANILALPVSSDIATAGTIDLSGYGGSQVNLTGTTTVTAFVVPEGSTVKVRVTDGFTATYDATNLPIRGKKDVLFLPDDIIEIRGGAGDVGEIVDHKPAAVQYVERVKYISGTASPTPDADTTDVCSVTITASSGFGAPTGTPRDEQRLDIHIQATGGLHPLSFDPIYRTVGCNLPTGCGIGELIRLQSRYNEVDNKWDVYDVRRKSLVEWELYTDTAIDAVVTRTIVPKTADYTVLNTDHNTIFTNTGTAADVTFTLPATGGCVAGKTRFSFYCLDAGGMAGIKVAGSDHLLFYLAGSAVDVTGGANVRAAAIGSTMTVIYLGGTTWGVEGSVSGDWA